MSKNTKQSSAQIAKLAAETLQDKVVRFGVGRQGEDIAAGVEIPAGTWHTVIALEAGCILLEVKSGPFDPNQPKDLAPWAPDEGGPKAKQYLQQLIMRIEG